MRVDPLLLDPDEQLPASPKPLRTKPLRTREHRTRALAFTPPRAAALGFGLGRSVRVLVPGEAPEEYGTVVAFDMAGRQAYVRWRSDLGHRTWLWLSQLEAL